MCTPGEAPLVLSPGVHAVRVDGRGGAGGGHHRALRIGLELYSPGYNIYVSGLVGTGRTSTVKELLGKLAPRCEIPRDRAYVRNFADPDRPRLLTFAPGVAVRFRR